MTDEQPGDTPEPTIKPRPPYVPTSFWVGPNEVPQIDGEDFPWAVKADSITVKPTGGFTEVTLTLFVGGPVLLDVAKALYTSGEQA